MAQLSTNFTPANQIWYSSESLQGFGDHLTNRFYRECYPPEGSMGCFGEYGESYYPLIALFIENNLVELAERVGAEHVEYNEQHLEDAWDLVEMNFPNGDLSEA